MAVEAKAEFRCWKEHTCVYCGARYRYLLKKTKKGRGETEEQAHKALEAIVMESAKTEVNAVACPECGAFQPDMIRARKFLLVVLLLLVAVVVFVLEILFPLVGTLGDQALVYFCGGLTAIVVLAAAIFGLGNCNRDPEANRMSSL